MAAVVILSAAYLEAAGTYAVAADGDNVSVYYTGSFTNGTIFSSNVGGQTLNFTVGSGQVIQGFDQAVVGMRQGQNKTVTVPANEAYGEVNPGLIVGVPLSEFANQSVQVGMTVTENASGREVHGMVTAVNATTATVDFNSPLAGQTLVFKIQVVKIGK